ncbi:MAG: type II toxin-antitoxin system VapC family toxin [Gemmatimonadetes bacterium]|nr:type II toxin-antitoxin system VapC family toxin [Gemmatimonadota bacterium]
MKVLLDTHFLLWIVADVPRVDEFPWLERYRPWGVSPVSFLEVQFLAEVGKIEANTPELIDAVGRDGRFIVDEVPLVPLIEKAVQLTWTRDPFDRLLAAHSEARAAPLCTVDRSLRREHGLLVRELRLPKGTDP